MKRLSPGAPISASLRHYRNQVAGFKARGLTTRGTRFQRRPNFKDADTRLQARRERGLRAWNKVALRRQVAGLTTRGGQPVLAYRARRNECVILLTEVEALATSLANVFEALPASAKAQCLTLSNHLATIRQRIL